ncbi:iron chaperone [Pyxidicoccus xibeiensis]|uniref:iron chaperone n=1 Tax=Pyxidicoccus xibeiensis TaxID=2906759 RepID=UPI0020A7AD8A|nr:DUF1801 domain-containing protein [Pyxidicoccus xibeiensis]MCP3136667.1 hypothetical protein [Pyxidicoccus xibeiensis]
MAKNPRESQPIDAYLESLEDPAAKKTLGALRMQLRKLLPGATETVSYRMPTFKVDGNAVAGFAYLKTHCGYTTSKSGISFPPDKPLPAKLVKTLVQARLAEIATNGKKPSATKKKAAAKKARITDRVTDSAVKEATGRDWKGWMRALDTAGECRGARARVRGARRTREGMTTESREMPMPLPAYLQHASIIGRPVVHRWGPGDAMASFGNTNRTVENKLAALSFRALLGLAAALGEWMHRRFEHLHDDTELRLAIEAIWAASIDWRYLKLDTMRFPQDDVSPIHGPLQSFKWQLVQAADLFSELDFGLVRYLRGDANLVRFVLPDDKAFQAWFKAVLVRLPVESVPPARKTGHADPGDVDDDLLGVADTLWGTPLPREAFDPGFELSGVDRAARIDAMLAAIAATPNPYLRTAAELAAMGFASAPYRYSRP